MGNLTDDQDLREILGQLKNSDLQHVPDFHETLGGATSQTRLPDAGIASFWKVVAALAASVALVFSTLVVFTAKEQVRLTADKESELNEMESLSQACDNFLVVINRQERSSFNHWHPTSDQFLTEGQRLLFLDELR